MSLCISCTGWGSLRSEPFCYIWYLNRWYVQIMHIWINGIPQNIWWFQKNHIPLHRKIKLLLNTFLTSNSRYIYSEQITTFPKSKMTKWPWPNDHSGIQSTFPCLLFVSWTVLKFMLSSTFCQNCLEVRDFFRIFDPSI